MTVDFKWIEKNPRKVDWLDICIYGKLDVNFMDKYYEYINWQVVSQTQKMNEKLIRKYINRINWYKISKYQKLSESFIEEYINYINWKNVSEYQNLSANFIDRHLSFIDFYRLVNNSRINIFDDPINIIKYADKIAILNCTYKTYWKTSKFKYVKGNEKVKILWNRLIHMSLHAKRIQKQWRTCITNPEYKICKDRLKREFNDLMM